MIERLLKYLIDFALRHQYSISIPNTENDKEIELITIDLKKKDIKVK